MPPTGMRRCRPLMSSGTRAVSVVLVGITHHGWQSDNCKNRTHCMFLSDRIEKSPFISLKFIAMHLDLAFRALLFPPWLT
jgi:hypothetical protein